MRSLFVCLVALLIVVGCSSPTIVERNTEYILTTEGYYRTDFNPADSSTWVACWDSTEYNMLFAVPIPWYINDMLVFVKYENGSDGYSNNANGLYYAYYIKMIDNQYMCVVNISFNENPLRGNVSVIGIKLPESP